MSEQDMFWFHCGRCGSLFQAEAGDPDGRLCSKCGFDPTPGMQGVSVKSVEPGNGSEPAVKHGTRTGRKRKGDYIMVKLIVGWSLLLVLIVFGARHLWHVDETTSRPDTGADVSVAQSTAEEDEILLQDALPKCTATFSRFLSADSPEGRNQFVVSPVTTASRMALFHSLNPSMNLDPASLTLSSKAVVHLPDEPAIETQWTSGDGIRVDAVFRKKGDEWLLDWDHYVRFSDYPWALFLAGTGPAEGEFRLLARERLADERKHEENISIVLYAPRFGHPEETGFQSPEFLVSRNERGGRLLDAAFKLARSGKRVFGATLPMLDPEGMIRVRVKVRRIEDESGRRFKISGVTACHWHATDEPGLEPPPPEEQEVEQAKAPESAPAEN